VYDGTDGLIEVLAHPTAVIGELVTIEVFGIFIFSSLLDPDVFEIVDWDLQLTGTVPEPATLLLFGAALSGIAVRLRRKARV
jgi:hypothetical protein